MPAQELSFETGRQIGVLALALRIGENIFDQRQVRSILLQQLRQKAAGRVQGDLEFADTALVQNFYKYVWSWLAENGAGAQLIVVDNSPPEAVFDDVVVEFTRDPAHPPYGLITDATE